MKKIISLIATVAMVSTLFVSVVKAVATPTVNSVLGEKLTNAEYKDFVGEDIPAGYDAYPVTVSFSGLDEIKCTIKAGKHSGRKLQGFTYTMDFDDVSKVDTDNTYVVYNPFDDNIAYGLELGTSKFNVVFNAGSAGAAYPKSAQTIDGSLPDCLILWVTVQSGEEVEATLSTNMNFVEYTSNTPGDDESYNTSTMMVDGKAGSVLTFGSSAPVVPTPVITDSVIDVKATNSGATELTDLQGKAVTLTKNYGIAKFTKAFDPSANNYSLLVTDTNNVEKEFDIDFAEKGVEVGGGSATFFAIVRSTEHIIKSIQLKELAK